MSTNAPDAPAPVPESLSTVGYALFALLQQGPLDNVPSFADFAATAQTAHPQPTHEQPAHDQATYDQSGDVAPTEAPVYVDPTALHTPPNPAAPTPGTHEPVATDPAAPPAPAPPPAFTTADGTVLPVPKNPVTPLPEYNGKETLAMLQEISFLDE